MSRTRKKKLIEVAIPLEAINAAAAREKSIRHGHPSTLHLWWARRPLAACRAVLFAQLVDDPSSRVDELMADADLRKQAEVELSARLATLENETSSQETAANAHRPTLTDVAVEVERKRLFSIIEDLVKWENSTNEEVLERARAEIRASCGDQLPPVYDPFSGGGSIPLEAQRLGLRAHGSDLNPVAVMIGKAMIEVPPRFKGMEPVHPGPKDRNHYRYAEGLAEDVKYYGEWMREKARERIGHLYPQVDLPKEYGGGKATAISWIWARTVPSPDPAFSDVQVPLISSYMLSSKNGKETWLEPIVDKSTKKISYKIRRGGTKDELDAAKLGSSAGKRQAFRCIISGAAIPYDYIRNAGRNGQMSQQLIAVVAERKGGRAYVTPDKSHEKTFLAAKPSWRPEIEIPNNPRNFNTPNYGLNTFADLYTNRQLVAMITLSTLVTEARERILEDCSGVRPERGLPLRNGGVGSQAYAEAVSLYLALTVDRVAMSGNTLVRWNPTGEKAQHLFGRQAVPMLWDYAETNPLGSATGAFSAAINMTVNGLAALMGDYGEIVQADAQTAKLPADAILNTDPPYYDNIVYADLSDFFYCWLRLSLRDIFPDVFGVIATPKAEELVATRYRHGTKEKAESFFMDGMSRALFNAQSQITDDFPVAIYYAFKQSEVSQEGISSTGWSTFLQAVIDAGLAVVGTWPVRTEMRTRQVAMRTNALANSVVLVCRKREVDADTITRAEFIRELRRELPPAITDLRAASVLPADLPQSAIGPGMGVFSRCTAVLEADDSPMTIKTALQLINAELNESLDDLRGEFDAATQFAATWFEQHGMGTGDYGAGDNLARARNISVDSVKRAGIVDSSAGKIRILKRAEMDLGWDPAEDDHPAIWKCCQHLIRVLENDGENAAALLLKKLGPGRAGMVNGLAYHLHDVCSNKRRDAREATSYNGLILAWTELTRLAAEIRNDDFNHQTAMNI